MMKDLYTGNGFFGNFGGAYVPEPLKKALQEMEKAFDCYANKPEFLQAYHALLKDFVGRESPLTFAKNLTKKLGGGKIYLKREDLNHTGAHKINNCIGQILLAKYMGKTRIVAETGAGQHGVATATVCALFNMKCVIYMGEEDMKRQALNVYRMKLLGAQVVPATTGNRTLKDAVDAALEDYLNHLSESHYLLGSAVGPHPYPLMVRTFQSVIGEEARRQILEKEKRLPDYLIACVGGGSNAIGLFHPFYNDDQVNIIGVEPANVASIAQGSIGVVHGFKCLALKDEFGAPLPVGSIAAGLDYPGVGPEHCAYHETNRATYTSVKDADALSAFKLLSEVEGIIPALESAHALAYAIQLAPTLSSDQIMIVNLSGRGDKDVQQVQEMDHKSNALIYPEVYGI